MLYPFICFSSKQCVRDHLAVRWRWAPAASDQTSHLKGCLTSLASTLHGTKKGLTMVSFPFFFACLFPFLQLPLSKLWKKHAPSLLFSPAAPSLHFSVLHRRGLLFSMCALGHLSNNFLRDILSVIQVLSAWAQGALINVRPFLTRLCAGLHIVMSNDTLQPFLSLLILIWHCSGHERCKYMR